MSAAKSGEHRIEIPDAAPSGVRRRIVEVSGRLHEGKGDRRDDCQSYSDCLLDFVKTIPRWGRKDRDAHCPSGCKAFLPISRDERIAAAMIQRNTDAELPAPVTSDDE